MEGDVPRLGGLNTQFPPQMRDTILQPPEKVSHSPIIGGLLGVQITLLVVPVHANAASSPAQGCDGIRSLEDPLRKPCQTQRLGCHFFFRPHIARRCLIFELAEDGLPSRHVVATQKQPLRSQSRSHHHEAELGVGVGIIRLDIVCPGLQMTQT